MSKVNKVGVLIGLLLAVANVYAVVAASDVQSPTVVGAITNKNGILPVPRFVAGSGVTADCITDKQTGLMWPKNGIIGFKASNGGALLIQPNYVNATLNLNRMAWSQASNAVININNAPSKLCGYSDWRLPNKVELKSMIHFSRAIPSDWLNYGSGNSRTPVCDGACFVNVQADSYWSSSPYTSNLFGAWYVDFNDGVVGASGKTFVNYVWPVRGGQ